MFAKLKKKIEEEVGDLGQLTSPLANPFGGGDRRVGGSTQGTNTPNTLGSRQSSLASLVDLHPIDEQISSNTNLSVQSARTSNSAVAARQKAQEVLEQELKKLSAEWTKKYDNMKKTYEERIQNQEADFAWKYSAKEDELEKVRVEKRKLEDSVKNREESFQSKMTRVHDDMDQLEGFAKQETAKVKHLLLNTQADLQKAMADLIERDSELKEVNEVNRNLRAENDTILRNMDRDHLQRVKFEAEHSESISRIGELQNSKTELEKQIRDVKEELMRKEERITSAQTKITETEKLNVQLKQDLEKELAAKEVVIAESKNSVQLFLEKANSYKETIQELQQKLSQVQDVNVEAEQLRTKVSELESKLVDEQNIEIENNHDEIASRDEKLREISIQSAELVKLNTQLTENLDAQTSEVKKLLATRAAQDAKYNDLVRQFEELAKVNAILKEDYVNQSTAHQEFVAAKKAQDIIHKELSQELSKLEKLNVQMKNDLEKQNVSKQELASAKSSHDAAHKELLERHSELEKLNVQLKSDLEKESAAHQQLIAARAVQDADHNELLQNVGELQTKTNELKALDEKSENLRQNLQKALADLAERERELAEVTEVNHKLKEKNDTQNIKLKSQCEELIGKISELQNSKVDLEKEIRITSEELTRKEERIILSETKIRDIEKVNDQLKEDLKNQYDSHQLIVAENSASVTLLNDQISSNVKTIEELKTELSSKSSQSQDVHDEATRLRKQVPVLESKLKDAAKTSADISATLKKTQADLDLVTAENAKLKSEHQANLTAVMENSSVIQRLSSKCQELEESCEQLQKEKSTLEERHLNLETNSNLDSDRRIQKILEEKTDLEHQLISFKTELEIKQQTISEANDKLIESEKSNVKLEQQSQEQQQKIRDLEETIETSKTKITTNQSEIQELQQKLVEEKAALDADHNELLVQVGELQSKTDELEEEIKFLKDEVEVRDGKIEDLREKLTVNLAAASSNSTNSNHSQEDVETYRERIRELESQLNDKNKALKLRQQQLQDLRKTLAKEMRNASSSQLVTSDGMTRSGSQNSLASELRPEEISLAETEPAVIQTSNSHRTEASNSNSYAEDVNFQYMKTVIFKFVTTSDPQVTHHLTKVVSTLLHLSEEEHRLLEKSTDKRLLSWLGPREHHGY